MTKDELTTGAKAMHDYFAVAIREQANANPHPLNEMLAEQLARPWSEMREDQRQDWREMFSRGIKAVAHGVR